MFDLETILKGIALLVAVGLLFSSIDLSYILAKLTVKKDKPVIIAKPVAPSVDQDGQFLKTLELWYMLKKQCDAAKLIEASKKMDEVFPLLNDNLEEG
jgi:hypothetical protein